MNINDITDEELCMLEQLTYLSEKVAKHILLKSSLRAAFFSLRLYNQIISALKNVSPLSKINVLPSLNSQAR